MSWCLPFREARSCLRGNIAAGPEWVSDGRFAFRAADHRAWPSAAKRAAAMSWRGADCRHADDLVGATIRAAWADRDAEPALPVELGACDGLPLVVWVAPSGVLATFDRRILSIAWVATGADELRLSRQCATGGPAVGYSIGAATLMRDGEPVAAVMPCENSRDELTDLVAIDAPVVQAVA